MYKHGLSDSPVMEETIQLMFSAMSQFRLGKSSTIFHNTAKELGHMVLTNKKDQVNIGHFKILNHIFLPYLSY